MNGSKFSLLSVSLLSAILAACGGGGGGSNSGSGGGGSTDVSGLEIPSQVDVISASETAQGGNMMFQAAMAAARAFSDSSTDYSNASQEVHVWHPAMEPIDMVNGILCFASQLRGDAMVNQGTYVALVNEAECFGDEGESSGSSENQSSGADQAPDFLEVIARSSRASDSAPMIMDIWIPEAGEGEAIKVKVTVTEGATDSNPFGSFNMSIGFFENINDTQALGGGELVSFSENGEIGFRLYMSQSHSENFGQGEIEFTSVQSAAVTTNADQTSGNAVTAMEITGDGVPEEAPGGAYGLAYNDANVLVRQAQEVSQLDSMGSSNDVCLSRTDFDEAVWRYDLYDADSGDRVDINSGFPIRYDSNGDNDFDQFGWVGYWGVWTEEENGLSDGDVVVRETFDDSTDGARYVVNKAPGKLIKHTVESMSVSEISGVQFHYHGDYESLGDYNAWIAQYQSGDNAGFYRTARVRWGEEGEEFSQLDTPVQISSEWEGGTIHLWSNELGGSVKYVEGASTITFYREEFMNGNEAANGELFASGSANLVCLDRCPVGTMDLNDLATWDSPYDDGFSWHEENGMTLSPISYTISNSGSNTMTLMRGNEEVRIDSSISRSELEQSGTPHSWGIHSGPMLTQAAYDALVATLGNEFDPWDIYNSDQVTEFYVWETGLDEWNQLTTLSEEASGDIVSFDKPLSFRYTHSDANDRNSDAGDNNGRVVLLEYGGQGDLWGIPHENVRGDNESDDHNRYYPAFNIADGTLVGPNSSEYAVKAREIEQKMRMDEDCGNLSAPSSFSTPPSSLSSSYDVAIGSVPTDVPEAPAVVDGEVQTE